jgi:AmmeMemoRadiSam system protein A
MSLTETLQNQLLALARQSIAHGLQTGRPLPINLADYPAELRQNRATFVTLERRGQLRGCIGMLEAVRPLAEDVAENAFAAAFRDRRFPPLAAEELADLDLHISVLSPAVAMQFNSEADLIAQLRPGIDGIILQEGSRRGTFLPSVWEDLSNPKQFLQHLKQKAGLPAAYWSDTIQAYRYTTEMFG